METAMLGTHLDMADAEGGTYKTLYGLQKVPDMSFEAEKIEVTNMQDKNKRYIPGIVDLGEPEFEFFNDDTQTEPASGDKLMNSYKALRAAELARQVKYFKLIYPDGTGFSWSAYVVTTRTGGGTGDALQFKVKMLINSNITDVEESAGGTGETGK
jgi:predicted secreted protein